MGDLKMSGLYLSMGQGSQEYIQEAVANFHIRNGVSNHDGSMGRIEITPGELRNLLAMMILVRL